MFYQLFTNFCNAKSKVLQGIMKIQQKIKRHRSLRVKHTKGTSGRYSLRLAVEISLLIFCCIFGIAYKTSLFVLHNHPSFSFLLLMDNVCSCSVVSIHFIVLSDTFHSFTKNYLIVYIILFMCFAFTTIFIFLLLYYLL